MAVDSREPNWFVSNDGIETPGRWKFVAVPQYLIPTAAQYPFEFRIVGGECTHALRRACFGCGADEINSQKALAIAENVAMSVD